MHFSSVFTREGASSFPVPETKFNRTEGERWGQLVVTTEVIANKINSMKDNKSPGVDGIAPKRNYGTNHYATCTCLTYHCRRELFL